MYVINMFNIAVKKLKYAIRRYIFVYTDRRDNGVRISLGEFSIEYRSAFETSIAALESLILSFFYSLRKKE